VVCCDGYCSMPTYPLPRYFTCICMPSVQLLAAELKSYLRRRSLTPRQPAPEHSVSPVETKTSACKLAEDGHARLLTPPNSYIVACNANIALIPLNTSIELTYKLSPPLS
jgi:hypothetical protein